MQTVQAIRPDREVMSRQRLPYFIGLSGQTVGALGLSMHIVVIPPGQRQSRIATSATRPDLRARRQAG